MTWSSRLKTPRCRVEAQCSPSPERFNITPRPQEWLFEAGTVFDTVLFDLEKTVCNGSK
jgi:hypothetical protein